MPTLPKKTDRRNVRRGLSCAHGKKAYQRARRALLNPGPPLARVVQLTASNPPFDGFAAVCLLNGCGWRRSYWGEIAGHQARCGASQHIRMAHGLKALGRIELP
ncbi:MAG: hypothetical protein ACE5HB_07950 [Terriglobia bacterium]